MKRYSKEQQNILDSLNANHALSVGFYDCEPFKLLEKDGLVYRVSLKNKIITYALSQEGEAYLEELAVDNQRYKIPLRLSIASLVLSALAIGTSILSLLS